MIDVITFRGTGEHRRADGKPAGMLAAVTELLDTRRFRCHEPAWPATIGPLGPGGQPDSVSLDASVAAGVDRGVRAIQDSPNVCGLLSYSLGGIVVSQILEGVAKGDFLNADGSPLQIAFAVNIANPVRARGDSVGGLCGHSTFGMHGEHARWPDIDTAEYANPLDIITAVPGDSPLRLINDAISPFSFVEGARLGDAGAQIAVQLTALIARNPLQNLDRYRVAFEGVFGYLNPPPNGQHVLYPSAQMPGTGMTYTAHAARHINTNH